MSCISKLYPEAVHESFIRKLCLKALFGICIELYPETTSGTIETGIRSRIWKLSGAVYLKAVSGAYLEAVSGAISGTVL